MREAMYLAIHVTGAMAYRVPSAGLSFGLSLSLCLSFLCFSLNLCLCFGLCCFCFSLSLCFGLCCFCFGLRLSFCLSFSL